MLGFLYIILCFSIGWVICRYAFPGLARLTETSYSEKKINVSSYILLLPAWFITGTIATTWLVYILASIFASSKEPLLIANGIVIPLAIAISVTELYKKLKLSENKLGQISIKKPKLVLKEMLLIFMITLLATILMWTTFYVEDGLLNVGATVFSDFSPHLGMIRSFSYGNNFPTTYSHFAGEDIKYHFMYQFLVGNLEFLGMRIDMAFNLPSILSFVSAHLLLYLLAVKITSKNWIGAIASILFSFRSSKTLFTYMANTPKGVSIRESLMNNREFISDTPNEDWGLWNLNVYANQRHLALGLSVMFFVIILFLPYIYKMFEEIKGLKGEGPLVYLKKIFFTKEAWKVKDLRLAACSGLLLGSLSFFHGAAVIGCLLVLFVVAIMSRNRLDFLIMAIITVALALLQSNIFIEGSVVEGELYFGFIAENKTFFGVLSYLERLLGILPIVLIIVLCIENGVNRYLMLAFSAPFIFAFTVSLTVDVTVNHKYIMMACILLGIFAASLVVRLISRQDLLVNLIGILLLVSLTITGAYDFTTLIKKNREQRIVLDLNSHLTEWVYNNSNSQDVFLTAAYTLNELTLGGGMLYQGHQYYAWSAGYDTFYRDEMVRQMYEAETPHQLDELVKENNISFIVVDRNNRISSEYQVNEDNIKRTYESVHEEGDGEFKFTIYDTSKKLVW